MPLQERFGTSDELYELLRNRKPKILRLDSLSPLMGDDLPSRTHKPILVRCDGLILDGSHRYREAVKKGRHTIRGWVITGKVLEDWQTGKAVALSGKCG